MIIEMRILADDGRTVAWVKAEHLMVGEVISLVRMSLARKGPPPQEFFDQMTAYLHGIDGNLSSG